MTMTKVRATIKVNDGLVTSFSRMAWRVLFPQPHPPFSPPSFSVTTPYVGRSIPDEMEYRYAEHPEGSVANIEKFLPERKKRRQRARRREREDGFTEGGRERERVIESFAFLENIIDRLELIGAETIGRHSSRSFAFARIHAADASWKNRWSARRDAPREFDLEFILTTMCVLLQFSIWNVCTPPSIRSTILIREFRLGTIALLFRFLAIIVRAHITYGSVSISNNNNNILVATLVRNV